jgi:non-haem Fe2+, alpha-ketoglutarate-dependent halogenase
MEIDIPSFHSLGFVGPLDTGADKDLISTLAERYSRVVNERLEQPIYGRYAQRDWHLVDKDLQALLTSPPIINGVRQILGDDLLLWRSKIFYKPPGGDAIGWHQEWGKFDGEEIGNSVPSLQPVDPDGDIWDLTVWIALTDVGADNGPLQFSPGTNNYKVPWSRVPLNESAFYENPFLGLHKEEIVHRAARNELILDIDTHDWLSGVHVDALTREETIAHINEQAAKLQAKYTDFRPDPDTLVTLPMRKGQFVIFTERTMHGSPPNLSQKDRVAVNARITRSDTLIYPGRLSGEFKDGSNLDIQAHHSLLVHGRAIEQRNVWKSDLPNNY